MTLELVPWDRLFAQIPIPVSVVDAHGRQVAANAAYARFLGFDEDEIGEIDIGRITRPEDQQWTRTYLMRLVSGEVDRFETEKVYVRKDGTTVVGHLRTHAVRDAGGVTTHLIASITPPARTSAPDEAQIRAMLRYTSDTLTVVDANGKVLETAGRDTQVLGYPAAFWEHRNIGELVAPDDWDRLLSLREHIVSNPHCELETEVEVLAADGSPQTLLVRAVNCLDDPAIRGVVLATRNITQYRETLAELSRRRETAEAVVDAQTRLLATVSHELRNPLHAVRGIAELLASEDLPPRAAELAHSLVRQLSGLTHVTQDLLDAARLDAGKITIEAAPTDLGALVEDVVALGRAAVGKRPVHVSSRIAHGVPEWVIADGDRLRQVLGNLVGNAVKFTETGTVQVIVRPDTDQAVTFSVIDTGVGIPLEEQAAVLEPFTVGSTAGDQRGAGLGLSIVYRLVTAMDGRLTMTSAPGEGTRFEIRLPLPAAVAPKEADVDVLPAGLTVLVVEDNPVNQQLARSQLERLGLIPVIVGTGEDGLALLAGPDAPTIDVVLMDHQLPGITGIETTQRLRQLAGDVASLPVIGLSASASASDRESFVDAGMDDFIAKPASLDDLSGAIARAVRRDRRAAVGQASGTSPDTATDAVAAVDVQVLESLARELGGPEIVVELVETFLDELGARTDAIVSALASGDDSARRAAHTLKSSARLLGAHALADACQAIERDGARLDVATLAADARTGLETWLSAQR